jgi:hypothetical protein
MEAGSSTTDERQQQQLDANNMIYQVFLIFFNCFSRKD